jgi:hypothetical protein
MTAASNIVGMKCLIRNGTRFPVQTDDDVLIATKDEGHMEQTKLHPLRQEDEIRANPKPKAPPTMQQVLKHDPPLPSSRDVTPTVWLTFLPPKPQSTPPWSAQTKVTFRGISGIQSKCQLAFVSKRQDGDNWDKDATSVFHLQMKLIDERTEVETDHVFTCRPDYDANTTGTTMVTFTKLSTSAPSHPVAIKVELNGHVKELSISSNASQGSVTTEARTILGQAVTFKGPKPIVWTPNATCHFELKMDLAVPVISAEARANLA